MYSADMAIKKTTRELVQERAAQAQALAVENARSPRTPISVLVDNVRSLDNVGLIFRLCELAHIDTLYLTGYTGHPRVPGSNATTPTDDREEGLINRHEHRIFKTAVYAVQFQPWTYAPDPVPIVQHLKEQDNKIIVLEQTDRSVPYHDLPITNYQLPLTLIAGHERQGVRQELIDLADHIVEIPIKGHGNSHNVSHAVAIVLYHILANIGRL